MDAESGSFSISWLPLAVRGASHACSTHSLLPLYLPLARPFSSDPPPPIPPPMAYLAPALRRPLSTYVFWSREVRADVNIASEIMCFCILAEYIGYILDVRIQYARGVIYSLAIVTAFNDGDDNSTLLT
jgi:hypothetical protein